ncbi:MAG TPA: TonB-dependent receptor, partial [Caulobacteraceae bacterium]|nr:TonB-dependent receptor [Caulobacteraceae bacterium]
RVILASDHSRAYEINYKATGSVETPVAGGTLKINASLLIDPYRSVVRDSLIPQPGEDFEPYFQRADTAEFGIRYARPLGARASVETYVLQQLGRQVVIDNFMSDPVTAAITGDDVSDLFTLHKKTSESIVRTTVKYAAAKNLSLEAGAEGDYNWLQSRTSFIENGGPVALPAANVTVAEARGEAFLTAVWRPRSNITVEGGLKGEASHIASSGQVVSARSLYFAKPRLLVGWSPDGADQLRVRVEREVGQLNFDDFTAVSAGINTGTVHAGNPALDPEQDWVFEAAWDRRFWGGGDATVTLRHYKYSQIEDRIGVVDPTTGIVFDAPGNIGAGTKDEAAFTLTLPTDKIGLAHGQLTGQAIFRRSRVIDPTTGAPRAISGLHGSDWEAHYSQGIPRLKATWGFDVIGQWGQTFYRFDEVDTAKLKTYVQVFAEYKPKPDLTFKIEVLNVTARHFENVRQIFDGPRSPETLAFIDQRNLGVGRFVRISMVKSFG